MRTVRARQRAGACCRCGTDRCTKVCRSRDPSRPRRSHSILAGQHSRCAPAHAIFAAHCARLPVATATGDPPAAAIPLLSIAALSAASNAEAHGREPQRVAGGTGSFSRPTSVLAPKQGYVGAGGTGVVPCSPARTGRRRESGTSERPNVTGVWRICLLPVRNWKRFRRRASAAPSWVRRGQSRRVDRRRADQGIRSRLPCWR